MTAATLRPTRSLRTRLLAILGAMLIVATVSQIVVRLAPAAAPTTPAGALDPTIINLDPGTIAGVGNDDDGAPTAIGGSVDLKRIRANIDFWSARVKADPNDFISSNRLGIAEIELARATGDLSAYARADEAFAITLKRDPANAAALGYRGSVLVSLHRFDDAAAQARVVLERRPNDPVALVTLADALLELGDMAAAREAYAKVDALSGTAAIQARLGHLAFIVGDVSAAVAHARVAVGAADDEGADGERAAFFRYQLADLLISSGDRVGAAKAYAETLSFDAGSFLAHSGLARVAAADGDLDAAIEQLSAAIAIVPQPEFLARRGDLYKLRGASGDAKLATADHDTVEAIAQLAGEAASVYDRSLAMYLANHGLEPERAVAIAAAELAIRKDVYGYDTYAWTLLAAGRAAEADTAMASALAFGTQDAKLLYHAGRIDAALGRSDAARTNLQAALDLDPSFDPLQAKRAQEALAELP